MDKPEIAFIGIGLMGSHMARNLLKAGYRVTVWNRTAEKAEALSGDGACVAASPQEAVANADITITMLSDGTAVGELLFNKSVAAAMKAGSIFVDMSSIKPAEAREHARKLSEMGIGHLDAPVSGGTKGAEAATLAIMAGGEEPVFDDARPVLEVLGRPVRVGPDGTGQLAKLANQTIVAVTIGVVAEAMLLAEKGGGDPNAVRNALKGGFADSVILQQHGERMTSGNFEPGGLSKFQLKDINNALEEAGHCGLTLPLTEHIQSRFKRYVEKLGGADRDHSGLYEELKELNGL